LGVSRSLHVQIRLNIYEHIRNGFHLLGKRKLLEDISVSEEADVQIEEKFVEGGGTALLGII
jgi:hypothetical protein